jgi:hypothetical protein
MGAGIAFGMGYLTYGVILLIFLAAFYLLLGKTSLFKHRHLSDDQLLRITIPESLEYNGTFEDIFARYLSSVEKVGAKTAGMVAEEMEQLGREMGLSIRCMNEDIFNAMHRI